MPGGYRYGIRSDAPFAERLDVYMMPEPNSGCWLWTGTLSGSGYGQFQLSPVTKKKAQAHRASYEYFVGPIPEGMQIDHLCRVRCCVNPAHLELVTQSENTRRGHLWQDAVTHCPQGHPYSPENLASWGLRKGQRICLICNRLRKHAKPKTQLAL